MAWLTLTDGAVLARLSYNVILRKVLVGDLRGERREGHWYVDEAEVRRLMQERNVLGDNHRV